MTVARARPCVVLMLMTTWPATARWPFYGPSPHVARRPRTNRPSDGLDWGDQHRVCAADQAQIQDILGGRGRHGRRALRRRSVICVRVSDRDKHDVVRVAPQPINAQPGKDRRHGSIDALINSSPQGRSTVATEPLPVD